MYLLIYMKITITMVHKKTSQNVLKTLKNSNILIYRSIKKYVDKLFRYL